MGNVEFWIESDHFFIIRHRSLEFSEEKAGVSASGIQGNLLGSFGKTGGEEFLAKREILAKSLPFSLG